MSGRLGTTKSIAYRLGITPRILLQLWRENPDFPPPVRNTPHHKWWDFKAIEQYLDKLARIEPESTDWNDKINKGLSHGENRSAISH